jgi:hypothetical protein
MHKLILLLIPLAIPSFAAYPNGYSYRGTFIVAPGQISGTLNNFPALISQTVADWAAAGSGGKVQHTCTQSTYSLTIPCDLIFTADLAGTIPLAGWEFVSYNPSTGAVRLWVNVPNMASGTAIYAWYGNASVTTCQTTSTATWNSNYVAVYHFAGGSLVDSTAHGNTLIGYNSPASATGPLGGGIGLNGTNQYAQTTNTASFTSYTVSVWANPTDLDTYRVLFDFGGKYDEFSFAEGAYIVYNGANSPAPGAEQWNYYTFTYSGGSTTYYSNGVAIHTSGLGTALSSVSWAVGANPGGSAFFSGALAEVRVTSNAQSANWIAAEYANQFAPGSFWGFNVAFPPTCSAGSQQVFRAGVPAQLSGSGASGDGSQLSYLWQQVQSAAAGIPLQRVHWRGQRTATPTVTGLVAGPFDVQLSVLQADGQWATCTVNDGVVATDSNGTIILPTNALGEAAQTLIGNQVELGKNPWPFYDQAAQWMATLQIADYDLASAALGTPPNYQPWWNIPATGTVSVTSGSSTISGANGTNFETNGVCDSGGNPTGAMIVVWYPTGRTVNGQPETGRMLFVGGSGYGAVTGPGCTNSTTINLAATCTYGGSLSVGCWSPASSWSTAVPAGSGLQYSIGPNSGSMWLNLNTPANYYDNVQAYYALYFRSGLDKYLIAARNLADRWWTCPEIDRGMAFNDGNFFGQQEGRSNSVSGLILRAFDNSDGHPDMWAGLHNIWEFSYNVLVSDFPNWDKNIGIDPRETGYILAQLAYCALWDQDSTDLAPGGITYQNYCRNGIERSFQAGSSGLFPQFLDPVQQGWLGWYEKKSTFDGTQSWSGSTVTLTNGSTAVTCSGSNCGWAASDFGLYAVGTGTPCSPASSTCSHLPVLFTDGATFPADSSHTDSVAYCSNGCTFIDSNHFTLDTAYQGTTGIHGWVMAVSGGSLDGADSGMTGWGQDTFMEGILGWAFGLAGKAMACTGANVPAGCDNTTSALAYTYLQKTATWLQQYAWIPTQWGNAYFGGYPACGSSGATAASQVWCTKAYPALESREDMGDSFRGLMSAFEQGATSLQTNLDNWYAGMWAKPGVGAPPVPSPDGTYDTSFDATGCTVNATWPTYTGCNPYYLTGTGISQVIIGQKVFGQFFGISDMASWPVARIGGPLPPHAVTIYVGARLAAVPGATKYQVTVTEPTGVVDSPVSCSSSPCAVTVNQGAGNPNIQVTYLSATGAALDTGQPFVVTVN